ncbi:cytochrome b/b6 domain-containing protein [Thioclava sp. GXIMD4216]|uniref:cytochrome b/b6 domain-containing protein n=1 Tax=Thioclava sp. GXIMD4216 TaxID=3131929 RepID=UPI0030CA8016
MLTNTPLSYGVMARGLHWAIALLILSAIGLGLYGESVPRTADTTALLQTIYSAHKTIGVATFFLAVLRVLWTLGQTRPVPLHPERRLETWAAEAVHFALYGAMFVMPLSGWITHAAEQGFAPIWWPFGQDLPFVPKSDTLAHTAGHVHKTAIWVLYTALALHVLGALKHVLIDRDATMARMTTGRAAGREAPPATQGAAAVAALAIWVAVLLFALLGSAGLPAHNTAQDEARATTPAPAAPDAATGNWAVTQGSLSFDVVQMGAKVQGHFGNWTADIHYDEDSGTGHVTVQIDTTSLDLGSVTDQAKGSEFFNVSHFATATFEGDITRKGTGPDHIATGSLTLIGTTAPLTLPFTLDLQGDTAHMTAQVTIDRRDWKMGAAYPDEGTVGFPITVSVDLQARKS